MQIKGLIRTAAALGMAGGAAAYLNFRRELKEACARLEAGSAIERTNAGPVEFGRAGHGEPVLMIHGAGGGYDQGLFVGQGIFGCEHDIIAPSRFGYLRTPLPADFSPAAQADAHAALLDELNITRCVVAGVSAGAPSAIEMALRHPQRVSALILVVPRTYDPNNVVGVQTSTSNLAVLKLIEGGADFAYWLAQRFARSALVRFLGVPPEVEAKASPADRERVDAIIRGILPLSKRVAGIRADSATELSEWPLEDIRVPTLIISAEDDLFRTLPGSRYTAGRIKGAELKVLQNGGHLMVGRSEEVEAAVADFLAGLKRFRQAA